MSIIKHKKAHLDYEILEEYEAGLELEGHEVKSLRKGQGKLEGGHVIIRGGEAFLVGMSVPPYQVKNTPETYDPERTRKLLLTKKEIGELSGYEHQKGLTIVPISVYNKGRHLKIKVAVARGKKQRDRREDLKKKDTKRDIERLMKGR